MSHQKKKKQLSGKNDNAKEKIISAAFELFATKGYAQTSVDSIAAKAKISKGLIYYYFKSKGEILKGILTSLMAKSGFFEEDDTLSSKQYLKKIVEKSFELITRHTKLFRLILALTMQPEVVKGLKKELESLRILWMDDLTKAFKSLGYKKPEMEAYILCAMFDGAGLGYISLKDYPIHDIRHFIEKKYDL